MGFADSCKRRITQKAAALSSQRRIAHHGHVVPLAPRQAVALDASAADVVKDLIGRTPIAMWDTEQGFHILQLEIGHAPRANLSLRTQIFEYRNDPGEVGNSIRPVQQIE